jgi:beta-lactam-binding protein with PASTA domain
MPYRKAESVLRGQGLDPIVTLKTGTVANDGLVTNQAPAVGTLMKKHDVVHLTVSRGPNPVSLPYVVNLPLNQVKGQLKSEGFIVHVVYESLRNGVTPSGTVLKQSLRSGDYPYGTTVTLTVARGLKQVKVPPDKAVVGQSIQSVRDVLTAAGFFINPVNQFSNTVPINYVITTDPAPGTLPSFRTWFTAPRAQRSPSSRAAHLNPDVNLVTTPGYLPFYVTSQSLAAGTQVKRGTTVVISVEQPSSTTTTTFSPVP